MKDEYDNPDKYYDSLVNIYKKHMRSIKLWRGYHNPTGISSSFHPVYYKFVNYYNHISHNIDIGKCEKIAKEDSYLKEWPQEIAGSYLGITKRKNSAMYRQQSGIGLDDFLWEEFYHKEKSKRGSKF